MRRGFPLLSYMPIGSDATFTINDASLRLRLRIRSPPPVKLDALLYKRWAKCTTRSLNRSGSSMYSQ